MLSFSIKKAWNPHPKAFGSQQKRMLIVRTFVSYIPKTVVTSTAVKNVRVMRKETCRRCKRKPRQTKEKGEQIRPRV